MRSPRNTDLVQYCTKSFKNIKVIGVVNHSVIVRFNKRTFVIYKTVIKGKNQYVIVKGENRDYVDSLEQVKSVVK